MHAAVHQHRSDSDQGTDCITIFFNLIADTSIQVTVLSWTHVMCPWSEHCECALIEHLIEHLFIHFSINKAQNLSRLGTKINMEMWEVLSMPFC